MPITHSAKKALRASARKKAMNDARKKTLLFAEKTVERLLRTGKTQEAVAYLPKAFKAIDKSAKTGVIKKNTAARKKSRLSRLIAGRSK